MKSGEGIASMPSPLPYTAQLYFARQSHGKAGHIHLHMPVHFATAIRIAMECTSVSRD